MPGNYFKVAVGFILQSQQQQLLSMILSINMPAWTGGLWAERLRSYFPASQATHLRRREVFDPQVFRCSAVWGFLWHLGPP